MTDTSSLKTDPRFIAISNNQYIPMLTSQNKIKEHEKTIEDLQKIINDKNLCNSNLNECIENLMKNINKLKITNGELNDSNKKQDRRIIDISNIREVLNQDLMRTERFLNFYKKEYEILQNHNRINTNMIKNRNHTPIHIINPCIDPFIENSDEDENDWSVTTVDLDLVE